MVVYRSCSPPSAPNSIMTIHFTTTTTTTASWLFSMPLLRCGSLLLLSLMLLCCVSSTSPTTSPRETQQWRRQSASLRYLINGPTISSSACNNIRIEPFLAELELYYYYRITVVAGTTLDWSAVQTAIHQAVINKLSKCDVQDQPLYALDLNPSHIIMETGNCTSPFTNSVCQMVEAATFILLDNGTQYAQELAYEAIQASLSSLGYLHSYEPNIESAQFVGALESRVVVLPNSSESIGSVSQRPVTGKIAIAAASISFILAAIFSFGVFRRITASRQRQTHLSQQQQQRKISMAARVGIRGRQEYFEHLTDEDPGSLVSPKFPHGASFILSPSELSDITFDDSASILSTISRTTSKLERIEEEGEGPYDEEAAYAGGGSHNTDGDDDDDDDGAVVFRPHGLRRAEDCHVHVVDDYGPPRFSLSHGDEDKASDLMGCRFVDDGSIEGEPQPLHEVAPMEDWNMSDDSIPPFDPLPSLVTTEEETEIVLWVPQLKIDKMRERCRVKSTDDDNEVPSTVNTTGEPNQLQTHQEEQTGTVDVQS